MLPALAVAESLRQLGAEVTFASNASSPLVRDAGYDLDVFGVEGFPREVSVRLAKAVGRAATAVPACIRILRKRRPDVVLGGGGYVAGPMVLASGAMRIPAALSEADAHFGLANRLASPFAEKVFLAYPVDGLDPPKYEVVGRPIPARSKPVDRDAARALFDLPADGPVVVVFGGSQGAQRLNEAAIEAFGKSGPAVLHLAGERDYPSLAARVERRGYRLLPFTDDFGAALSAADLVVARAGGSVWEIASAGRPALLVPYPHATADHQSENARFFESRGGAVVVPEPDLDLRPQVEKLLGDPERLERMGRAMSSLSRPDAADRIAEELMRLAA
ncbi:MAG TPA: UDP-N-acetylglucosamine--N-acetylmuramyl-(pentapeptide) pyrophosphoryl-undecaprenol N-acetylglucosamine transferase [Gaiellaceae bacterium]